MSLLPQPARVLGMRALAGGNLCGPIGIPEFMRGVAICDVRVASSGRVYKTKC